MIGAARGPRGLSRDPEHAVLFGVCAGIAQPLGIPTWGVRLFAVIALVLFTMPVAVAYVVAAALLPRRGLGPLHPERERRFWREAAREAPAGQDPERLFDQEEWT